MHFDMDIKSIYQIILPKEGSIKFTDGGTFTLQLKHNKKYFVSFYDRNFMFRSNNPEMVPKNGISIKSNAYAFIYINIQQLQKVNPGHGHIFHLNPAAILIQRFVIFECM